MIVLGLHNYRYVCIDDDYDPSLIDDQTGYKMRRESKSGGKLDGKIPWVSLSGEAEPVGDISSRKPMKLRKAGSS